jgi:hypothetical protein
MNGANTVRVMIGAIWPSFLTMKNTIPASQGIETNTMISFFLFWLLSVPFLCMHPNNLRWLFMAKSVVVPVAWIGILIWAFVGTNGGGEMWAQKATLEGSAYSWAFLSSMTSVIGNYATLSVNQVCLSFSLLCSLLVNGKRWGWGYNSCEGVLEDPYRMYGRLASFDKVLAFVQGSQRAPGQDG